MSNIQTIYSLEVQRAYQPHGYEDFVHNLRGTAGLDEFASDALTTYQSNALTTTAVAIKASAGSVYGVAVKSNGTAGYVSLWNVAQGAVTVGSTTQDLVIPVSATSGEFTRMNLSGSGTGTIWNTAITAAAATTARGNTVMTNLPNVWILYA